MTLSLGRLGRNRTNGFEAYNSNKQTFVDGDCQRQTDPLWAFSTTRSPMPRFSLRSN